MMRILFPQHMVWIVIGAALTGCASQAYYLPDGRAVLAHPTDGNTNKYVSIYRGAFSTRQVYEWWGNAYWCVQNCSSNESPVRTASWPVPEPVEPMQSEYHYFGAPRPINRPALSDVLPCLPDEWCPQ